MRILHVIAAMDPKMGGVCQAVRTMAGGLTALGLVNEVASLDDPSSVFLNQDSFKIHALGPGKGPWYYNPKLTNWLSENLLRFEAVIVHGLWQYHGYAVQKALKKLKSLPPSKKKIPKLFVMPHGMLDPYFQHAPDRKLKALRNTLYWKLIEARLVNTADGLLFTCEEESLLANEPFKLYKPKRRIIIGLGVDPPPSYCSSMKDAFREKCPELNNDPYILFLSRIHEKKGVDLLINSYLNEIKKMSEAKSELAGIRTLPKLIIAGPGLDTPFGYKMQKMVMENEELNNKVFFPGMLTGTAKWGAFYGCEAFILPSHQENFGIAVVEALACARPVLISHQVNIWREIHEDGGCYVADSTLAGTKKLLEYWKHSSSNLKKTMSINALQAFKNSFSTVPAANRLLKAIQES